MNRQIPALGEPPDKLAGFPTATVRGTWFRAHAVVNGPWWFSHSGAGRFDLQAPHGTCYLASRASAAVHERLGETLVSAGQISGAAADRMVVSALVLDDVVADATVQRATTFGVTREIATITPYELPQRWAEAFNRAGHGGLRYWPRFSLSASFRALALFGKAGADVTRPVDSAPVAGRAAARAAGLMVVDPPRAISTVTPPG